MPTALGSDGPTYARVTSGQAGYSSPEMLLLRSGCYILGVTALIDVAVRPRCVHSVAMPLPGICKCGVVAPSQPRPPTAVGMNDSISDAVLR